MWLLLSFCPQNLGGGCYQQVCYCNFMKLARHIHLCPKYKYYCHRALGMQKPPLWQGCNGSHLGTRVHTQSINIIVMPNLIICTLTLWEIWSSSKLLKNILNIRTFWSVLMIIICGIKIDLTVWASLCQVLILQTSSIVQLFDFLTSNK